MADSIDLSNNEYNDQYNFGNHYRMLLFRPDSIISQRDLNELQSEWRNQFKLMGDYVFSNGTRLSGMILSKRRGNASKVNLNTATTKTNLISLSGVSAINSEINTDNWFLYGNVSISPNCEKSADYPGIELNLQNIPKTKGNYITVSFGIKKLSGNLQNVGFSWENSAQETDFSVDDVETHNGSAQPLNAKETAANLNDGAIHTVSATFQLTNLNNFPMFIVVNNGLDMTQSNNTCSYLITNLMVNAGSVAQPWEPSGYDNNLPDSSARTMEVNVSDGFIYLDGSICQFNSQNVYITGNGKETIGVKLNQDIVTAPEDPSLYDTTKGAVSQGERLADRLHYDVQLTYNDPNSVPIYHLVNGKIINGNSSTGDKKLDALLAARTYDQSGSFRVNGFEFDTEPDKRNSQTMTDVWINAGIAYVMGYGVYKLGPTILPTHISNEEGSIDYEPLRLQGTAKDGSITSLPLGTQPVDANSVHVYGPVIVQGSNDENGENSLGSSAIANSMDHTSYANGDSADSLGMDKLPPIFQNQNGASGGVLGTFYVHFGTQNEYQYIYKYDAHTNETITYSNIGGQPDSTDWDHWDIPENHKTGVYKGDDGITPVDLDGQWYLNWGNGITNQMNNDFPTDGGSTIYIDGIANYAYQGPEDVSGERNPDYILVSSSNPEPTLSAQKEGVPVQTSGNALSGARVQFGGKGTSMLMPPDPYTVSIDTPTYANYKYYKATVATLTLDEKGNFQLVKGTPAPLGVARPPEQVSPDVLVLGYVTLIPDSWKSNCKFSSITRIPFSGLQDLVTRVSNLESIVQNDELNIQAKQNINPMGIQNILNDDFTNFATADVTYEAPYNDLSSGKMPFTNKYYGFHAAYDLANGIISTEDYPKSIRAIRPTVNSHNQGDYHYTNHLITAPLERQLPQEEQDKMNDVLPINGQVAITSNSGLLNLSPNGDDYVNNNEYEFQKGSLINNIQLHNWFSYNDDMYPRTNTYNNVNDDYHMGQDYNQRNLDQWSMKKATGLETASTSEEFVTPRTIHFSTQWLSPNSKNYYILLNDSIPVSVDAINDHFTGDKITLNDHQYNTVNVNNTGYTAGSFVLPSDLNTGIIKVSLVNGATINTPSISEVSGTYYANGIKNDDVGTVEHNYSAKNQYGNTSIPPVVQTVKIRKDSILTQLKLYFTSRPNIKNNPGTDLLVQLRKVTPDGTPSDVVIAQSTVTPQSVNAGVVPTTIEFSDPVYVHGGDNIAICIATNTGGYGLAIYTQQNPNDTPYLNGQLFTSDGNTLQAVPHHGVLRFELDRGSFAKTADITFNANSLSSPISKVALLADYLTPDNTSLKWTLNLATSGGPSANNYSLPINRRRVIEDISDQITDSGNTAHDVQGNPLFNQISSMQLVCHLNDSPNQITDDEANPGYSRVSPLINADTVALAVSESMNSTNLSDDTDHLDIQTNYADYAKNNKKIPVTPIYNAMENADGLYITRNLQVFGEGYNTITTSFDAHVDAHCKVIPIYSFSQGRLWGDEPTTSNKKSVYPGWCYYSSWDTDPAHGGKKTEPIFADYPKVMPVDHKFNHYTFKVAVPGTNIGNGDSKANFPHNFQMGLLFYSDSPYHQPMVRRLSNILTIEYGNDHDDMPSVQGNQKEAYLNFKQNSGLQYDPNDLGDSNNFNNDNNSNY